MQRLRVKFSRGDQLKFLSHLDLMRLWERVIRRAGFEIAYSEGFSPHARISLAAPLPLGTTSVAELMDIWLSKWESPSLFAKDMEACLPEGIEILDIKIVSPEIPSLQSRVQFADYEVYIESEKAPEEIENSITSFLEAENIPWQHSRDKEERYYNLRSLVEDIRAAPQNARLYKLNMRLRCDNSGSGRPEQVARALGFNSRPVSIRRTDLILK